MPESDIQHDCHAEVLISLSSEWRQPERNQANYKNQPIKQKLQMKPENHGTSTGERVL